MNWKTPTRKAFGIAKAKRKTARAIDRAFAKVSYDPKKHGSLREFFSRDAS